MFKRLVSMLNQKVVSAKKVVAALALSVLATPALATESPIKTAINGAISSGQENYGLVVVGLIGLAALGFGLGMIVSSMRNS